MKRPISSIFLLLSLLLISILLFFSCSSLYVGEISVSRVSPESDDSTEQAQPKEGQSNFVYALTSTEINFDPIHAYTALESQIYTAIYEGLVTYNPVTLAPVPAAASHWEKSQDGKNYRFHIREGAAYSNGDPVKAQDFRDSWFRILDPDANAEYSTFFDIIVGAMEYRTGKNTNPDSVGIRVVSDSVLDIELETPAAHFLKVLCHMSFVPIHPHYVETEDWDERSSIMGNGPFYILERTEREIVFVKNNLYWDAKSVKPDRITIRFYNNPTEISMAYNRGFVDWAINWDSDSLEDNSDIIFNPLYATSFYFFKCIKEPWNDFRVRRALALLVPWDEIRNSQIFYQTDKIVPETPNYPEVDSISEPNRDEAFSLLEAAGFPKGSGLPEVVIRIPAGGDAERIAGVMSAAWQENLNVEVRLDLVDYRYYFDSMKQDDYVLGRMTWIGDFADPLTFLQMWTSDSNLNDAGYDNAEYDRLIKESIAEEGKARSEKFSQAESIILSSAVVLPISNQPTLNLIDLDYIKGWYPNPLDIHPFKYIYFKEDRLFPNLVKYVPE